MTLPIPLDRRAPETLQEQIYGYIRAQILGGAYPAGLRLCSTRELAETLRVSRNTAVLAYQWLASEGYVDTQAGAGTFVCDVAGEHAKLQRQASGAPIAALGPAPAPAFPPIVAPYDIPNLYERVFSRRLTDLWYGRNDPRQFPAKIWRRLVTEHLFAVPAKLAEYAPPAGAPELRAAIAEHLVTTKGIVAAPEQVIVTAGAQDALNLVSRLFIERGARVGVESPGYGSAVAVFRSYGADILPLPVDTEGVTTEAIRREQPRLVYATPSHQFPTGTIMTPARRQALLLAAEAAGAYVVEDDYDGEIIYDRPPVAALAALDHGGRVIYVGSFSKSLGAGLRLGYVVVPPALVEPIRAVKALASYGHSWLEQVVLAAYLRSGSFTAHLRRVRLLYRERRDALMAGLRNCFGDAVVISGAEAGLHILCTLPLGGHDALQVTAIAEAHGIGLHTPELSGAWEAEPPLGPERRLVIGYANLTPSEIAQVFRSLGQALHGPAAARPRLVG